MHINYIPIINETFPLVSIRTLENRVRGVFNQLKRPCSADFSNLTKFPHYSGYPLISIL